MPIDPTYNNSVSRLNGGQSPSGPREARQPAGPGSAPSTGKSESTRVHRLDAADTSRDIDTARVDAIRQGIADGTLVFDSTRIADGLIASARELIDDE